MSPQAKLEFIQFLIENKVLSDLECRMLMLHSDEWGTNDDLDDMSFANEVNLCLENHSLNKETIEMSLP